MHIASVKGLRTGAAIAATVFAFWIHQADARVLTVGPGRMYATPAKAAAAVQYGDIVEIYPGTYGGAEWNRGGLTIIGMGTGATITGAVQRGKGLFNVLKSDVTIQNLTFQGAKNGSGNGAGIRFEGTNLTVLNSRFLNNQNGILQGDNAASTMIVKNSTFRHNGACVSACAHALYVGRVAKLDVENSTFADTQRGHSIKSRALNSIILNNSITDGTTGTSSYLIDLPKGGAATIMGNTLEKGPNSSNPTYAISIGEEGPYPTQGAKLIANNTYRNDKKKGGVFVRNTTGAGLTLTNNTLSGYGTAMLQGAGTITSQVGALVAALEVPAGGADFAFASPMAATADAPAVPEESSWALLAAALAAMAFFRRKRA